jgi:Flp pilus assembly protein TadG
MTVRLARRCLRLWRCSGGTAAVEFAFVFPLLIILIIGIYSVGSLLHSISSVRYALEDTARLLQMDPSLTQGDLQELIDERLSSFGKQAVTLTMAVVEDASGSDIAHLTATYPYTLAVPFIPKYEGAYEQSVEIFLVIAE